MTNEDKTECDGWAVYGPDGQLYPDALINRDERRAWWDLVELEYQEGFSFDEMIVNLKGRGYTVRPVKFVEVKHGE